MGDSHAILQPTFSRRASLPAGSTIRAWAFDRLLRVPLLVCVFCRVHSLIGVIDDWSGVVQDDWTGSVRVEITLVCCIVVRIALSLRHHSSRILGRIQGNNIRVRRYMVLVYANMHLLPAHLWRTLNLSMTPVNLLSILLSLLDLLSFFLLC